MFDFDRFRSEHFIVVLSADFFTQGAVQNGISPPFFTLPEV
jgi:hypothetical protein